MPTKKLFQNISSEVQKIADIEINPNYHVLVEVPDNFDDQAGLGEGGPWGWGGYTTEYLESIAISIEDAHG
jgi:hypothetical protein